MIVVWYKYDDDHNITITKVLFIKIVCVLLSLGFVNVHLRITLHIWVWVHLVQTSESESKTWEFKVRVKKWKWNWLSIIRWQYSLSGREAQWTQQRTDCSCSCVVANQCIQCTINVLNAQLMYRMQCTNGVLNAINANQCIECNWCTINIEQWWWPYTCSFGREQTSHQGYSSSRNALYASCACCLTNTANVKLLGEIQMHNFLVCSVSLMLVKYRKKKCCWNTTQIIILFKIMMLTLYIVSFIKKYLKVDDKHWRPRMKSLQNMMTSLFDDGDNYHEYIILIMSMMLLVLMILLAMMMLAIKVLSCLINLKLWLR